MVTAEAPENSELGDMERRLGVAAAFTIPLLVLAMTSMAVSFGVPMRVVSLVELALALPVCLWAAWPFYARAWISVVPGSLNMFTLIGLGVGVAFLVQRRRRARARRCFRRRFASTTARCAVYFEAAAVIVTLVLARPGARAARARSRTGAAIRALLDLAPKTARRVRADGRRRRRAARPMSASATACAFVPAKRFRSTASCVEGASAASTSR